MSNFQTPASTSPDDDESLPSIDWTQLEALGLSTNALAALQSHLDGSSSSSASCNINEEACSDSSTALPVSELTNKIQAGVQLPPAPHNSVFKKHTYWEERFAVEEEYDWLLTYAKLKDQLVPLLNPDDHILIVGCGNSTLSADLYDAGYKHITNIDFSATVIDKMKLLHETDRPMMQWVVQDMTALQFASGSFDVVLDKASMDALMVAEGDVWYPNNETIQSTHRMCTCVTNVLKPTTGRFLQISFAQPHFRTKYLMGSHLDPSEQQTCSPYDVITGVCERYGWSLTHQTIQTEAGCLTSFLYVMRKS